MKQINIDDILRQADELRHYGVPGMKWGERRKLKKMSDDDIRKYIARKKLENEYTQVVTANRQAAKQKKAQERTAKAQERKAAAKARVQARLDKIQNKANQINAKKNLIEAEKALKKANIKLSKKDRKKVDELNKEKEIASAKAEKLAAQNRVKEERKKGRGVVGKILEKLGWAAVDGVVEAGKGLIRDKLSAFGREKLGLTKLDPDDELKRESSRATWKRNIKDKDPKRYKELFGDDEAEAEGSKKEESKKEESKKEESKKEESKPLALPTSPNPDRYGGRSRQEIINLVKKANKEAAAEFKKRHENDNAINNKTNKKKKKKK